MGASSRSSKPQTCSFTRPGAAPFLYRRSDYARSEIGDGTASVVGGPDEQGPEHDLLPDLPPSWVPKLTVPRDMLDMRCPRVRFIGKLLSALPTAILVSVCYKHTGSCHVNLVTFCWHMGFGAGLQDHSVQAVYA